MSHNGQKFICATASGPGIRIHVVVDDAAEVQVTLPEVAPASSLRRMAGSL